MKSFFVATIVGFFVAGCSNLEMSMKKDYQQISAQSEISQSKKEEIDLAEKAAIRYYKIGGFAQCAKIFSEVADAYHSEGDIGEQKSLTAKAKCVLWAGDKDEFAKVMEQLKGFYKKYELPEPDIQLLVNLADRMAHRPLTYPVEGNIWNIFYILAE